jgi:hypothetical protein
VIWIKRLFQLLDRLEIFTGPATFLPFQLSSRDLERAVLRPFIFDYKWLRSSSCRENPIASRDLSTSSSELENLRLPFLLPGGRWLIAAHDDGRCSDSVVCLWDLDHGTLKGLPEAQMLAEGIICSMDVKMDQRGSFAFMVILSEKNE